MTQRSSKSRFMWTPQQPCVSAAGALGITLAIALAGCRSSTPNLTAFDFMEGTWTTVKDGLSLTVEVRRAPDGRGWIESATVDDGNVVNTTATIAFDTAENNWVRVLTLTDGNTSTSIGGVGEHGEVVLEQKSYAGRPIEPPQSRLVYTPQGTDKYVLDWQSRGNDGGWVPRPAPFVHERVDRPAPPGGTGRIAFISNREGNWEIYTMADDGSDVQNVTRHPAGDHRPRWIAGNTRLAFRTQRARDDGGWDRWEIDIDGSDPLAVDLPARLHNPDLGTFPEVHPSGSWIVNAAERNGDQDIHVWRFDGGGERTLAPAPGLDYRPMFSPDGSHILFISERNGDAEVYTVTFEGDSLQRLTNSAGIDRYARWSPDGSRIGFVSERDGDLEVFVMDADGTNARQLTHNTAEDGEISWAPDGKRIAFRSDESGNGEIHVVDIDSGEIRRLTQNEAYDGEPVWSPLL